MKGAVIITAPYYVLALNCIDLSGMKGDNEDA